MTCFTVHTTHTMSLFKVAVQSRFNEAEGAPQIYHDQRRELRPPPVDTHPNDQRLVQKYFIVNKNRSMGT